MTTITLTQTKTQQNPIIVSNRRRAAAKWVEKSFLERNLWENLASIDLASKKCYEVQPRNPNAPPTHNIWLERLMVNLCNISSNDYTITLVSLRA